MRRRKIKLVRKKKYNPKENWNALVIDSYTKKGKIHETIQLEMTAPFTSKDVYKIIRDWLLSELVKQEIESTGIQEFVEDESTKQWLDETARGIENQGVQDINYDMRVIMFTWIYPEGGF